MAYNHGREERKWHIWKETEEKVLRECGVDETIIEQICMDDRADFNSNRWFYRWTNDIEKYFDEMAGKERLTVVKSVAELLDENESLYHVLVTVVKHILQIVLLKMQGYSIKEIAQIVHLITGTIYAQLAHLGRRRGKYVDNLIDFKHGYGVCYEIINKMGS